MTKLVTITPPVAAPNDLAWSSKETALDREIRFADEDAVAEQRMIDEEDEYDDYLEGCGIPFSRDE